jgi:DMSO/TMAO reductase YedYZ heme-binding membrane subunit
MTSQTWWYVARSGGLVAWSLAALSVLWGFVLSSKLWRGRVSGPKLLDLHRFLGGLAVVFMAVHLLGLFADSYTHFGPVELLVPMTSDYRPGAVAWGVVAFYLVLAVELTSLLRNRLPERVWRAVHVLSVPVFVLGTVHGLLAGTDAHKAWVWWPAVLVTAFVVASFVARLVSIGAPSRPGERPGRSRPPSTAKTPAKTAGGIGVVAQWQAPYRSSELGLPVFGTMGRAPVAVAPAAVAPTPKLAVAPEPMPMVDDATLVPVSTEFTEVEPNESISLESLVVEPVELTFDPVEPMLEVVDLDTSDIPTVAHPRISPNDASWHDISGNGEQADGPAPSALRDPAVAARIDLLRRTYARLEQLDISGTVPRRPVIPYIRRLSDTEPPPLATPALPRPAAVLTETTDSATRLMHTFDVPVPASAENDAAADGGLAPIRALPVRVTRSPETPLRPFSIPPWTPAAVATNVRPAAAPRPPDAIDPETGEPDMHAYRRWLHEWLSYVESHPA